jgi:hypothetical protein
MMNVTGIAPLIREAPRPTQYGDTLSKFSSYFMQDSILIAFHLISYTNGKKFLPDSAMPTIP